MKRFYSIKYTIIALLTLMVSCTSEEVIQENEETKGITMIAEDFKYDLQSRTDFDITDLGAIFKWSKGDKVGVFPTEGAQADFHIISGEGSLTATFNGAGWALKPSSQYMAYYPLIEEFKLDKTAIPISFEGQTQTGNSSTAHLGKFDFMTASAVTPERGNVKFNFKHLCALVELNFNVPNKGNVSSITLSCDKPIFIKEGSFDLTSPSPRIQEDVKSQSIQIKLKELTTSSNDENIKVYLMMPPTDLAHQTVTATVVNNEIEYIGNVVKAKKLEAGKAYKLSLSTLTPSDKPSVPSTAEWIDMGLSVKWASHNVGANFPEDYGSYFAWGEISPKIGYTLENSLTYDVKLENIAGNPKYDAATANWGSAARMPTFEECKELVDNCTFQMTTSKGVKGQLVTSKINGNSIFLPAAGCRIGVPLFESGINGYYWSATPEGIAVSNRYAYFLYFMKDYYFWGSRYNGYSVRPVRN